MYNFMVSIYLAINESALQDSTSRFFDTRFVQADDFDSAIQQAIVLSRLQYGAEYIYTAFSVTNLTLSSAYQYGG